MRVAMDGSFLHLPPSGTGTYLRQLIPALRDLDPAMEIALLEPLWPEPPSRARRAWWDWVDIGRAARRSNPSLLHIPHFSAPLKPSMPLVVTIHDVIPLMLPEYRSSRAMRFNLAVIRRTVRRAKMVLTPSHAAASDIERVLGIERRRIRVTPEAAGAEYTPSLNPGAVADVTDRLGVTGRFIFNVAGLDVRKNLPVLIDAFGRALPRIQEPTQLVIAGAAHSANPSVYPPLMPVINRMGLEGAVLLTGRISEEEKIALFQGASLYVTPSLFEGFGLTALEAMACGVPTIAANRTSLPEVVGEGGVLIEPDPATLAEAMVGILNSPDRAAELRRRGLERAATFSWRRTAELTRDAYLEALDGERTV